jgi:hypothetical protein
MSVISSGSENILVLQVAYVSHLPGLGMKDIQPLPFISLWVGTLELINSSSFASPHQPLTLFHILDQDEVSKSDGARSILCEFCTRGSVSYPSGYLIVIILVPPGVGGEGGGGVGGKGAGGGRGEK